MKKDIGFRFSEETHAQLLDLSGRWGCTRTEVIEALVREAVRAVEKEGAAEKVMHDPARSKKAHLSTGRALSQRQVPEPHILPRDPEEVAAAVEKSRTKIDPDKIAAFQRKMAKGKK